MLKPISKLICGLAVLTLLTTSCTKEESFTNLSISDTPAYQTTAEMVVGTWNNQGFSSVQKNDNVIFNIDGTGSDNSEGLFSIDVAGTTISTFTWSVQTAISETFDSAPNRVEDVSLDATFNPNQRNMLVLDFDSTQKSFEIISVSDAELLIDMGNTVRLKKQ